jgi:iron transport multicopper oxidase
MLRSRVKVLAFLSCFPSFGAAATKSLGWNVAYTTANPDGQYERRVMGVNGQWPPPAIELDYGDNLMLTVKNSLGDAVTGLHAHGLFQNGTNYYDGPAGVVQWYVASTSYFLNLFSGIPPGESLTYNFTVLQNGTYWIHSHVMGQYPDGLRTPFIIRNPKEPYQYDEDITVTVSDWYHAEMNEGIKTFMTYKNPTGAEPVPQAALMNDQQNGTIPFQAGKTYRIRFVNMAAFAMFHIWIEDHDMRVIELDGVYTEEYTVPGIDLTTAQRVSVLVTAKNSTDKNYAIVGAMDTDMFDIVPDGLNPSK